MSKYTRRGFVGALLSGVSTLAWARHPKRGGKPVETPTPPELLTLTLGSGQTTLSVPVGTVATTTIDTASVAMLNGVFVGTGTFSLFGTDAASFAISSTGIITAAATLNGASYSFSVRAAYAGALNTPLELALTVNTVSADDLVAVTVANVTSSLLTAPYVQFYQPFKQGDLTDGNLLLITDDLGGTVTYTAARRANWPLATTNRSGADMFCKLPNNIAAKISISSATIAGTTATVTTGSAHGLASADKVLIQPANTDTTVGNPSARYCGLVTVTVTGASTFTYPVPGDTPSGSATVGLEMCYTRTLTIARAAGTWNDALPGGKTSGQVLTDVLTNFDNITLELTDLKNAAGAAVGSGTYAADFATASAAAGTDKLRVVATGPTLCDFVGIMKFADTVGGARHSTVAGWFYVSALLNPSTGAVVEVNARALVDQSLTNVAMSYYTFRSRMKLGSTIVRSLGLSTNAAIDGKVQTFAAAAVNTTTDVFNIPSHGFQGGERVQLTTTGTLPAPLALATSYAVIWVDGSNIKLATLFDGTNQQGATSAVNLTSQGSGNHTVTCWQQSAYATRVAYVGKDGLPDRWTGTSGALATIGYHVIHDLAYLRTAKVVPQTTDFSINIANPVAEISSTASTLGYVKARYVFGSPGIVQYGQDAGGAGRYHEYGAAWTDIPSRRVRYCNDRGFAQTLRITALGYGSWDMFYTQDDTNWRPPVVNNGPDRAGATYTGMSAPHPTWRWFRNVSIDGFTPASNYTHSPGLQNWSNTHRYQGMNQLYVLEGRQEIHDLMVMDAMQTIIPFSAGVYTSPGDQLAQRGQSVGGTVYYSAVLQSEARSDAFTVSTLAQTLTWTAADAPERPVIKDYFDDSLIAMDNLINTQGPAFDPDWLVIGTWNPASDAANGPGAAFSNNGDFIGILFEGYIGQCFGRAYNLYPSAKFTAIAPHMAKFTDNMYRLINNSWFSNSTAIRTKRSSGTTIPTAGLHITSLSEPMMMDQNIDAILYRTDGMVWGLYNGNHNPVTYPAVSDRHQVTTNYGNGAAGAFAPVPPELAAASVYFVRQPSGTYYGWKYATTDSDGTIVSAYSAKSTTTSATNIGTGTTSIATGATLTGYNTNSPPGRLVVIVSGAGTEICFVTAGFGTSSLTITRARYGTTALAHGTGATVYVPHLSGGYFDLQMRNVAFPPTGHAWRYGAGDNAVQGYRTMMRKSAAEWYANGVIARTAFENADQWFNDDLAAAAGGGPPSFAAVNSLQHSAVVP